MGVEDEAMEPSPYHLVAEWFDKWTESDGVKFKHLGDFGADFFIEKEGDTFYLTSHGPGIELIIKSDGTMEGSLGFRMNFDTIKRAVERASK